MKAGSLLPHAPLPASRFSTAALSVTGDANALFLAWHDALALNGHFRRNGKFRKMAIRLKKNEMRGFETWLGTQAAREEIKESEGLCRSHHHCERARSR